MNNSHLYELIGESIWDTYSDMAYLIMEKKLSLPKKIALTTLACVGAACPVTKEPKSGSTDLRTAIQQYQDHPSTIKKRDEAAAKRAAIAKRDERDQGAKRVLQRHYGFGDDGKMLSRADHLKSMDIFKKSEGLRARGPR